MGDKLRNLQYRDIFHTKLPRNLRYNDRISARVGTELRSPFMDHRLIELAMRQPESRKIEGKTHKALLRRIVAEFAPQSILQAPKRPVQTPQREWLRGTLKSWANEHIENAISQHPDWLNADKVRGAWAVFQNGKSDCSNYIWQWITISLMGV
jgi:asparagine synthase (glutamine-hydrolysing)